MGAAHTAQSYPWLMNLRVGWSSQLAAKLARGYHTRQLQLLQWHCLLEHMLLGHTSHDVLAKVLCDKAVGAAVALSAFYTGMSILQGKNDLFLDLKQKFWNTYKACNY